MRITALIENTAAEPKFCYEHGLSLFIESGNHKILFDAGASANFIKNAELLNIDIPSVDIAVLSHGHSDHSGGMGEFLRLNSKAKLYAGPGYWRPHFNAVGGPIGVDDALIDNPRIVEVAQDRLEFDDGITIVNYSKKEPLYAIDTVGMTEEVDGKKVIENFTHEQYLIVAEGDKRVIFTGCGHRGMVNIMNWSKSENLSAAVGGFHFMGVKPDAFETRLAEAAHELLKFPVTYWTCHCTGKEQFKYMKSIMGDRLYYLASGNVIEI